MRIRLLMTCVLLLSLGGPRPIQATTLVAMTPGAMVDLADLIFAGTAVSERIAWSPARTASYTLVTFEIRDVLKGSTDAHELTLQFLGSTSTAGGILVAGMPVLTIGDSYLLFVEGNGAKACPIVGFTEGVLRYAPGATFGSRVLVDSHGSVIAGVSPEAWQLGVRLANAQPEMALSSVPKRTQLLAGETAMPGTPTAEDITESLRSLVTSRSRDGTGRFREGLFVPSTAGSTLSERSYWVHR